jgi:4-hydroxy-tetrahydrodipicolinate reductase
MTPTNLVVIGGLGRLGRAILEAARNDPGVSVTGVVEREGTVGGASLDGIRVAKDLKTVARAGDVVIDASGGAAVQANLRRVAAGGHPYVLASTGYGPETGAEIERAARAIAIVVAPNLSVGVAVLSEAVRLAAAHLPDADVEIVETHHRNKADAPSGTALKLAEAVRRERQRPTEILLGRPAKGERSADTIGVHAVRGGDVVGEHRVFFYLDGERIELAHLATTRAIFARGALQAARFVASASPGRYTMRDVLGFKEG